MSKPEFKIGDCVRLNVDAIGPYYNAAGKVIAISDDLRRHYDVELYNGFYAYGIPSANLILIDSIPSTPSSTPMSNKFKTGQIVRCIHTGVEFKVLGYADGECPGNVIVQKDGVTTLASEDDLSLVSFGVGCRVSYTRNYDEMTPVGTIVGKVKFKDDVEFWQVVFDDNPSHTCNIPESDMKPLFEKAPIPSAPSSVPMRQLFLEKGQHHLDKERSLCLDVLVDNGGPLCKAFEELMKDKQYFKDFLFGAVTIRNAWQTVVDKVYGKDRKSLEYRSDPWIIKAILEHNKQNPARFVVVEVPSDAKVSIKRLDYINVGEREVVVENHRIWE